MVGIYLHLQADPDSLCSALALYDSFKELQLYDHYFILADSVSKLSKQILGHIFPSLNLCYHPLTMPHLAILVDAGQISQLGSLSSTFSEQERQLVIDHHTGIPFSGFSEKCTIFTSHETSSTAQMVWSLLRKDNFPIGRKSSLSLLCGMLFDSRRFIYANSESFTMVLDLDADLSLYPKALSFLNNPAEYDERVARMKSARRASLWSLKVTDESVSYPSFLLCVTHVKAYGASSARNLLHLGADFAAVLSYRKKRLQLSLRCSESFKTSLNFSASEYLAQIASHYGSGTSGGHPTAAGMNLFLNHGEVWNKKRVSHLVDQLIKHFSEATEHYGDVKIKKL